MRVSRALHLSSIAVIVAACGGPARGRNPAGPVPGEAPPTSDTEATAPPQPDPSGTAPVVPEKAALHSSATDPVLLPAVQTTVAPATVPADGAASGPSVPPKKLGAPIMKRGKIEVTGAGYDVASVTRVLNKQTASFLLCFQHAADTKPDLRGTTTLTFKIASDGKVSNADTSGGLDPEVEQCLAGIATGIAFPKVANGSANVSYPLTFEWK